MIWPNEMKQRVGGKKIVHTEPIYMKIIMKMGASIHRVQKIISYVPLIAPAKHWVRVCCYVSFFFSSFFFHLQRDFNTAFVGAANTVD